MIVKASSKRATRWSYGKPYARYSVSFQPAPSPSTRRPPLISSTVAAFLAIIAGLWKLVEATSGPIVTRLVAVEQVIAGPDRVETHVLRGSSDVGDLAPPDRSFDLGQLNTDSDRTG